MKVILPLGFFERADAAYERLKFLPEPMKMADPEWRAFIHRAWGRICKDRTQDLRSDLFTGAYLCRGLDNESLDWDRLKQDVRRERLMIATSAARYLHAQLSCMPTFPLWILDESATLALVNTDLPQQSFASFPRLPFRGIFLTMPPLLRFEEGGQTHIIDGIYLSEDISSSAGTMEIGFAEGKSVFTDRPGELVRGISIVGVEQNGNVHHALPLEGEDLTGQFGQGIAGAMVRVALNFLFTLHAGYLLTESIKVSRPKSDGKAKRATRQGVILHDYTLVTLGVKTKQKRRSESENGSSVMSASHRPHVVRGHWNHYWTLNEEEAVTSFGQKVHADGVRTLFLVGRWIPPYFRGNDGPPPMHRYYVRGIKIPSFRYEWAEPETIKRP